jgi:hypothetical protein
LNGSPVYLPCAATNSLSTISYRLPSISSAGLVRQQITYR